MKITPLDIPEVLLIEPAVYEDERGFFFESFNQAKFEKATGLSPIFVQDNHSKSLKGVMRGSHYQLPPKAQGKLVRVIQGEVYDVAVDIRKNSPTFGQWVSAILSSENRRQLWIPIGFAHGFLTLSETAEFLYKTTDFYSLAHERCIVWNDNEIAVDWPTGLSITVSQKDADAKTLSTAELVR